MRKLKYLAIFTLPITVWIALTSFDWLCYLPLLVYFGLLPFLELFIQPGSDNLESAERIMVEEDRHYDYLLFMTVPVQLATLIFFLIQVQDPVLNTTELVGRILAMGLMCGVVGINVGHELGHRPPGLAHRLGEILMLTSLENHFIPYHNLGHHLHVATPEDPATARRNEPIYTFWFRSHFGSYIKAWQIEHTRLGRKEIHWLSFDNKMVVYTLAQIILCSVIVLLFNVQVLGYFLAAASFGIILLETVNYIEHYGLLRKQKENGRYERVQHQHSWNSDHLIGRAVLFELSRHSDHHFKASKKYQTLDSLPTSPQMPTGYPGMMLFALVTPVWCWYMNRKIDGMGAEA